ncbi:MAG: phosphoribosylformylglycinamidine synthase subunit PurS, partial [Candidatus Micrarchaeota archaeon]
MPHSIEVGFKRGVTDAFANSIITRVQNELRLKLDNAKTTEAYTISDDLSKSELEKAAGVFTDAIIQENAVDAPLVSTDFDWAIEIGFRPGVTDNAGNTAREALQDALKKKISAVYYSKRLYLNGALSQNEIELICSGLLANGLIQSWRVIPASEFKGFPLNLPVVKLTASNEVEEIKLNGLDDTELSALSEERVLVLSLEEMKTIRNYYEKHAAKRKKKGLPEEATDVELECLAQTWSEHCKHKIFNAEIEYEDENGSKETIKSLFKTFIKRTTDEIAQEKDWLVSVFKDNAGVIRFNDKWNLVFKVETHNSPSALDPYGGALTGILGVNRDTLGTGIGSKPIFNTDVFCFASPFFKGELPPRLMHPKRIFEGVRKGVEDGGNKSGIPVVNGSIVFHDSFSGKPLVYCGTGG